MWDADGSACGPTTVPSPKSNVYAAIGVASPSLDADASAVTASGSIPDCGVTDSEACGGESTVVTWAVAWAAFPAVSVTVVVTRYVPAWV